MEERTMKRILVFVLALVMMLGCMVACSTNDIHKKSEGTMTHAEYVAAAMDSEVVIEAFVQATQGTWEENGKQVTTLYLQDKDGGYFAYQAAISKAEFDKIVEGTKVRVTGTKGEWAGEVEVMDGTVEVLEGNWIAEAADLTFLLGKDELINHQNEKCLFKGMTVVSWSYKGDSAGDDIYLTLSKDGAEYPFCVEAYLTNKDSEVYKAVEALKEGDVIDVEGFLYWYDTLDPHVTAVTKLN
jgi:hypothetical protein